jgi:hypothetical protein
MSRPVRDSLPELEAGCFCGLAIRLPFIGLRDNRRQHAEWEQHALRELRHGEVSSRWASTSDTRATHRGRGTAAEPVRVGGVLRGESTATATGATSTSRSES